MASEGSVGAQLGVIERLGSIGSPPGASPQEQLQRRFLVYMAVVMCFGGATWGGIAMAYSYVVPALIPLGYIPLTVLNLAWFASTKAFARARAIQIFFSLLLPFFFQWSLGGFVESGAMMLWALVPLVGSLTFTSPREMVKWLVVYCALVVVSGFVDATMRQRFAIGLSDAVQVAFFVVNLVMISAIVVGLILFFIEQRARALAGLADANLAIADLRREVQDARKFGQYTLVEKLGEGGMGTVYRARHAMLRRPVAIKLVRPDKANDTTIGRFEREVQLTSTLTHPNTVTIYDYGRTDDGTFYYVMEYLDGADLGVVVSLTGPLGVARTVHVLRQIAEALAEAHNKGLIHRDIKPANVLLTLSHAADVAKVVDFGLVKEVSSSLPDHAAVPHGTVAGTPNYMSPESLTHPDQVSGPSDVYSLGCLAYYLLTASTVFSGESTYEIYNQHVTATPAPISVSAIADVPKLLEDLVMGCLAKTPEDRPTAAVLAEQLRRFEHEPWARWGPPEAEAWWLEHGSALAGHRARHSKKIDQTVVARLTTPAAVVLDKSVQLGQVVSIVTNANLHDRTIESRSSRAVDLHAHEPDKTSDDRPVRRPNRAAD